MTKEITETMYITVPVKLKSNGTKEARKAAVAFLRRLIHIEGWTSECGGITVKGIKGGIKEMEAPK